MREEDQIIVRVRGRPMGCGADGKERNRTFEMKVVRGEVKTRQTKNKFIEQTKPPKNTREMNVVTLSPSPLASLWWFE